MPAGHQSSWCRIGAHTQRRLRQRTQVDTARSAGTCRPEIGPTAMRVAAALGLSVCAVQSGHSLACQPGGGSAGSSYSGPGGVRIDLSSHVAVAATVVALVPHRRGDVLATGAAAATAGFA